MTENKYANLKIWGLIGQTVCRDDGAGVVTGPLTPRADIQTPIAQTRVFLRQQIHASGHTAAALVD